MNKDRTIFITAYAQMEKFILLSNDLGDLYKVTINYTGDAVHSLTV